MDGGAALRGAARLFRGRISSSLFGAERGLGLFTKARNREFRVGSMEQPPGGRPGPDYLVEAAFAHSSAAKVWEALAEDS